MTFWYLNKSLFKSYKARKITQSVMGAVMTASSSMFDSDFTLRQEADFSHLEPNIALQLFTDSKTLLDVLSEERKTSEKN